MNRPTGCDDKDGGSTSASQSKKSLLNVGIELDDEVEYESSDSDYLDLQSERREKFKANAKELKKEIKAVIGSDSPLSYELDCSGSKNKHVISRPDTSEQDGSGSERSLAFTVGGKSFLMNDPRTLSEIFQEEFGGESAARVYGFSTESLDYLKANPNFVTPEEHEMKIPHDEIQGILNGFSNIYLAHEISVNPEFRLHRYEPPEDSIPHKVQEQMKKAYWDIFDEHLGENPPNYNQALSVFVELKEILLSLLLPHNHQMRQRINTLLQLKQIKEAIVNDTFTMLDFKRHADFIIETLGQLCCPSRDQDIAALKVLEKPSELFRGIMEVMEKMKLDMANFFVMQFRPNITAHCVQSQRKKLADFMEAEYRLKSDGLAATRNWLLRHRIPGRDAELAESKALGELLNYNQNLPFPEILLLDVRRCTELSNSLTRLSIIGAIILTVTALAQTFFQPLPFEFRSILKKHMLILMPLEDMNDKKKFDECIERAAEQAAFIINEMTKAAAKRRLTKEEKETVRTCVRDVGQPDHKIRSLLGRRILDHAEEIALVQRQRVVTVPGGLSSITHELAISIGEYQRLISHNRRAFRDIYDGILLDEMPSPTFPTAPGERWDPTYVETIELLRRPIVKNRREYAEFLQDSRIKEEKAKRSVTIVEPPKPSKVKFPQNVVSSVRGDKDKVKKKKPVTGVKPTSIVKQKRTPLAKPAPVEKPAAADKLIPVENPTLAEKVTLVEKPAPEKKIGELEEGDEEEGEYEYEYEEGDEDEDEEDEDEEGEEEEDEEEEEGEEGAAGPPVPPVPVVPRDPNAVSTFVKPPRERIKGARIELFFLPRGMPKRYLLKSGADGIARLIPNLEKTLKKKKKKRRSKKRVRILPKEDEYDFAEEEPGSEISLTKQEITWTKVEKSELREFCCGKPATPEPPLSGEP